MADRAISLGKERPSAATAKTRQTDVSTDLAREREEVLRLRDMLIMRDRELGAALGRAAELEAERLRIVNPRAVLRRFVPAVILTLVAKLRR